MNKKEKINPKEVRNQNDEGKKMNTSENSKKKKNKDLPWWVEFLFVQIGLPDNLLIKILKAKKKSKEIIKNDKKSLITFFFVIISLAYFYPVVKQAKSRLDCEKIAKNYIIKNKNIIQINNKELKMLSTNFCYGGEEIYEIENLKNKIYLMTDIRQRKENVKMHLKDLRQNLKKMHLAVTEELILPKPDDVKTLMKKMDQLLKLIESK